MAGATGNGRILTGVMDVLDPGAQQKAVARCVAEFGKLDVVIPNAGLGIFSPLDQAEAALQDLSPACKIFSYLDDVMVVTALEQAAAADQVVADLLQRSEAVVHTHTDYHTDFQDQGRRIGGIRSMPAEVVVCQAYHFADLNALLGKIYRYT